AREDDEVLLVTLLVVEAERRTSRKDVQVDAELWESPLALEVGAEAHRPVVAPAHLPGVVDKPSLPVGAEPELRLPGRCFADRHDANLSRPVSTSPFAGYFSSAGARMAAVAFEQVSKVYPDGTTAVSHFDLNVPDGQFVVLVGPSGCGKTTALRMLAGLEDITRGVIKIGDR